MTQIVRIMPVEGRRVRDPQTGGLVPGHGLEVVAVGYWARRIAAGDVTVESGEQEPIGEEKASAKRKRSDGGND